MAFQVYYHKVLFKQEEVQCILEMPVVKWDLLTLLLFEFSKEFVHGCMWSQAMHPRYISTYIPSWLLTVFFDSPLFWRPMTRGTQLLLRL